MCADECDKCYAEGTRVVRSLEFICARSLTWDIVSEKRKAYTRGFNEGVERGFDKREWFMTYVRLSAFAFLAVVVLFTVLFARWKKDADYFHDYYVRVGHIHDQINEHHDDGTTVDTITYDGLSAEKWAHYQSWLRANSTSVTTNTYKYTEVKGKTRTGK